MTSRTIRIFSFGALFAMASCARPTGSYGALGFSVAANDAIVTSLPPLAAGKHAELEVFGPRKGTGRSAYVVVSGKRQLDVSKSEPWAVVSARSSNPSVLDVVGVNGHKVLVRSHRAGNARLHVATAKDSDEIEIRVVDVDRVELDHAVWGMGAGLSRGRLVLLRGGVVHFQVRRLDSNGKTLFGYDVASDVLIEPAATVLARGAAQDAYHLRIEPKQVGTLTLRPTGADPHTVDVVNVAAVATLRTVALPRHRGAATVAPYIDIGDATSFVVVAELADGRHALGLDGLVVVSTSTPTVCSVTPVDQLLGDGVYVAKGQNEGDCAIHIRLGKRSTNVSIRVGSQGLNRITR